MSSIMDLDTDVLVKEELAKTSAAKNMVFLEDYQIRVGSFLFKATSLIRTALVALAVLFSIYAVYSVNQLSMSASKMGWPMFDCSRTSRLHIQGNGYGSRKVTYHTCLVDNTNNSINPSTGVFTVPKGQAGVYQISFTAKFVANSNGRFGAWCDIYVGNKVVADLQREYNGNRTESSTHTVVLLHILREGDEVYVMFNKDGTSFIHSDDDHDVHFTVRKVAD